MFKALSNPHRLAVFQRLASCCAPGTACALDDAPCLSVGQLGDGLDIAASTLSHHMKTLSQAGLVQTRRQGKQVLCWIEAQTLQDLATFFAQPLSPALPSPKPACRPRTQDS